MSNNSALDPGWVPASSDGFRDGFRHFKNTGTPKTPAFMRFMRHGFRGFGIFQVAIYIEYFKKNTWFQIPNSSYLGCTTRENAKCKMGNLTLGMRLVCVSLLSRGGVLLKKCRNPGTRPSRLENTEGRPTDFQKMPEPMPEPGRQLPFL